MPKRHRRSKPRVTPPDRARDLETIRIVNEVLSESPVDLAQLRKVAAVRGLVNNYLRRRVWPLLLGIGAASDDASAPYSELACGTHRDTQVVQVDVERSLWAYTNGWSEVQRDEKRAALKRLLTAVVTRSGGAVHYYQGLHDIASVLLMTVGEAMGYRLLVHLTGCQLRDCTRPSLDAVLEQLPMIVYILKQADAELAQYILKAGILPYFALSWYITWFAHEVQSLPQIARLFDLFMASHPLMPLYVGAVAMKASREKLLAVGGDDAEMHSALSKLSILGVLSTDELAVQALALYKLCPPEQMLRSGDFQLQWSVAPAAELRYDHWWVPDEPRRMGRRPRGKWLKDKPIATAALLSASTFAAVIGAGILMQLESESFNHLLKL